MASESIRYVAQLEQVREVSLLGTADLAYWRDRLQAEGLIPAERSGRAQLLLVAADARFFGLRFQELSFSVLVGARGETPEGAFLVQAFNSRRFFAFCERRFFKTPYQHGQVAVTAELPASIRLTLASVGFEAWMRERPTEGPPPSTGGWEGPVYLPTRRTGGSTRPRKFFACIRGETHTIPFRADRDALIIRPSPRAPVLQDLVASAFTPLEWVVRPSASHAKSKTYPDDQVGYALA